MLHTLSYFKSTDRAATQSDTTALSGTAEYVQNSHQILPFDAKLVGAIAMGTSLSRFQVDAPILLQRSILDIWPFERAAIPSTPGRFACMRTAPVQFRKAEEIRVLLSGNGTTGTNENWTAGLFFSDGNMNIPTGDTTTIQATGTTTLVANAWTNVPLTFSQALPAGFWEIVGLAAYSANAQLARLVLPGQWNRPGVVAGNTNLASYPVDKFFAGSFGSFGRFYTSSLPSVEFLSNVADTAETVWLKMLKVG